MRIGVLSEVQQDERRVALVPEVAAKLVTEGSPVIIESGAGERAGITNDAYREVGVAVEENRQRVLDVVDVLLLVQPLRVEDIAHLHAGALTISFLQPATQGDIVQALAGRGVTAFSLELLPRISRAQSMDALSSQASLAGYKAVVMAANRLGKFFPMLMTAAGTIPPARVLVLGAGVAGLQAIATAHRLGAVVEVYDVRPAAKEEVQSLGATFLELKLEAQAGTGGYAREQSEEFLRRQRELLTEHVAGADVVITTAAIPGKRAPLLVTAPMVQGMRRGSVLVDLAAETGGNCEGTQPGRLVERGGVWIDGTTNIPSLLAFPASQLYARNVSNLLHYLLRAGEISLNFDDELTKGCCVTHAGAIIHEQTRLMMGLPLAQPSAS